MRFYSFSNMYLSSLQVGLQSSHVVADLLLKYVTVSEDYELSSDPRRIIAWQWARDHKTMVLLNAGFSDSIRNLIQFFDDPENPYPWSEFYESEEALDGALTSVGIVLPEKIYEGAKELRLNADALPRLKETGSLSLSDTFNEYEEEYTKWEADLMVKLNTFGLAK